MSESMYAAGASVRTAPLARRVARVIPPVTPASEQASSTSHAAERIASWAASADVASCTILKAPLRAGETAATGFARKEAELRHVFAQLGVVEARTLHRRLVTASSGDELAQLFLRLTVERRDRLLQFLADTRRRNARNARQNGAL
jgi:hypothetical protein